MHAPCIHPVHGAYMIYIVQVCRVVAYHLLSYGCFDDAVALLGSRSKTSLASCSCAPWPPPCGPCLVAPRLTPALPCA